MSTQANALDARNAMGTAASDEAKPSAISRWLSGFLAAQERAAQRRVAREISHLSDEHLVALGLAADQIEELRKSRRLKG